MPADPPDRSGLTVIIPTYNVEAYLDRQLTLLRDLADEVLVCDSYSTDKTLEIAARHGVRVIQHEYVTSAIQKNWAIPQASFEWVLILDSDEIPEPQLTDEIRSFLQGPPPTDVDLVWIPRKNLFWGKWMRRSSDYPDRQSRLFRRDKGRYDGREVHSHVVVPGRSVQFEHALIHDDFTDISSWWLKTNRYLRYELQETQKRGRGWSFRRQFVYPWAIFGRDYFLRGAFIHGVPGFFRVFLKVLTYVMVQFKIFESELQLRAPERVREKSSNPR
ncbi:MAG: glycosyltransferase family 2 protein [Opitutaceae bacterium]